MDSSVQDIEAKLVEEVAAILGVDAEQVKPDAPLHTLGIDSMGLVEILVFVEKTFALRLVDTGLSQEHLQTLRTLAACVAQELQK